MELGKGSLARETSSLARLRERLVRWLKLLSPFTVIPPATAPFGIFPREALTQRRDISSYKSKQFSS